MPGIAVPGDAPAGNIADPTHIASYARDAGFPLAAVPVAVAIALAESGGNTLATHHNSNGTTDYGLFQINSVHSDLLASGDWKNPADNAKMAYAVYKSAGSSFTPWASFTNRSYKDQLDKGTKAAADAASPGISGVIPNPLGAFGGVADLLGKLLTSLTSADFWKRAGVALGGTVLVLIGLIYLLSQSKTGRTIKGAATAVATKGAV